MPIPTTCPGCRAAFEVPDNLAGKAIRCTSCKTQLTVPAAAPAGGSKKPFGWAGSAAAEPEPVAAEVAPAAEVEEEEAPAPAKKAAKIVGGVKKAAPAAKRRRDDDDDEDDTPRRKKRDTGGAGGAMWLLIGGGALALAAVVGVGIWLLTGKKDDTAKNTNTTLPAANPGPQPDDANPARPGPGPGRPAGEAWRPFTLEELAAELPGTPVPDNGTFIPFGAGPDLHSLVLKVGPDSGFFAVRANLPRGPRPPTAQLLDEFVRGAERGLAGGGGGRGAAAFGGASDITQDGFPGKELRMTDKRGGTGGGVMRVVVAGDKLYLFGTASDNFPAFQAQTQRYLASVKIAAAGPPPTPPETWQSFSADGFSADFPGAPSRADVTGVGTTGAVYVVADPGQKWQFVAGVESLPPALAGKTPETVLDDYVRNAERRTIFGGLGGQNLIIGPATDFGLGGFPGKELRLTDRARDKPAGTARVVVAGDKVFAFTARAGDYDAFRPRADRFLASATITHQPARPPDPKTDPPVTPPKVDPPVAPPSGAEIVAKLAHKVSPFHAGAFDPEKKELVAVGARAEKGFTRGTIQLYGVPGFKPVRTVNVPNTATRAVVDPKKGLLYVATAPATTTAAAAVDRDKFDRGAHLGDVAVYDLAAVRKAEEKSDVKPVATVAFGRVIRDLALSDDGKSLYVLSTTPPVAGGKTQPKAQVAVVDTLERKVSKAKDLPDPAWQMFRSGDGKKLYVTGLPVGNEAPALTLIDPVSLALAPSVPLPKTGVYDAAPVKDGRIVMSVPGANNAPFGLEVIEPSGQTGPAVKATVNPASNNGYVGVTPDGKFLVVSAHHPTRSGPGVDVYEVTDTSMGERKAASFKQAGAEFVGGTFLIAPEGNLVVFHKGEVVDLDDLGNAPARGGAGNPVPPVGVGMPPVGFPPVPPVVEPKPPVVVPGMPPKFPGRPPVPPPGGGFGGVVPPGG